MEWISPKMYQVDTFEKLKIRLAAPSNLALPRISPPYMVDCDVSYYAVLAVLLQHHNKENPKEWATMGYGSKILTK